jgi:glycosyltransferase involved in cell wall biosynthesis
MVSLTWCVDSFLTLCRFWYNPFQPSLNPKGRSHKQALGSYTVHNKKAFIIAKTQWTANMIKAKHSMPVHMVEPSMNHEVYAPNQTSLEEKYTKRFIDSPSASSGVFRVVAMVRPTTPRRNPENTLDVILRLVHDYPDKIVATVCGCKVEMLLEVLSNIIKVRGEAPHRTLQTLASPNIKIASVVTSRDDMANMFRGSDVFVDLSWWQAFGRSGVEAMACGCVAIFPSTGGADEICGQNRQNCLVHDGNDVDGYYKEIISLLQNDDQRKQLIANGIRRSWDFTVEAGAASMAAELKRGLSHHRKGIISN